MTFDGFEEYNLNKYLNPSSQKLKFPTELTSL